MSRLFFRSVSVGQFFVVCVCCTICFSLGSQAWAQTTIPLDGRKQGRPDVVQPRGIGGAAGGVTLNDFQPLLDLIKGTVCLLYTSPSPRDRTRSRMPSSA